MNITTDKAGSMSSKHILDKGFEMYETIEGCDMGQLYYSMPQYKNNKYTITGGYWHYKVKNLKNEVVWEGWWNSNEEFDQTFKELNSQL